MKSNIYKNIISGVLMTSLVICTAFAPADTDETSETTAAPEVVAVIEEAETAASVEVIMDAAASGTETVVEIQSPDDSAEPEGLPAQENADDFSDTDEAFEAESAAKEASVVEATAEPETQELKQTEAAQENHAQVKKVKQIVKAKVYQDEKKDEKHLLSDVRIEIEGMFPEGTTAIAFPVNAGVEGEETYAAYQIIIFDADGREIHASAADGSSIKITIYNTELVKLLKEKQNQIHSWRKEEEKITDTAFELNEDGGVSITTNEY